MKGYVGIILDAFIFHQSSVIIARLIKVVANNLSGFFVQNGMGRWTLDQRVMGSNHDSGLNLKVANFSYRDPHESLLTHH